MHENAEQSERVVQPTVLQETVISKPGAVLEVKAIEIPPALQMEIARGLQQGRAAAQECKQKNG
jgi:hypothetical protein